MPKVPETFKVLFREGRDRGVVGDPLLGLDDGEGKIALPERRSQTQPRPGEVWTCRLLQDTQPGSPRKGAWIVRLHQPHPSRTEVRYTEGLACEGQKYPVDVRVTDGLERASTDYGRLREMQAEWVKAANAAVARNHASLVEEVVRSGKFGRFPVVVPGIEGEVTLSLALGEAWAWGLEARDGGTPVQLAPLTLTEGQAVWARKMRPDLGRVEASVEGSPVLALGGAVVPLSTEGASLAEREGNLLLCLASGEEIRVGWVEGPGRKACLPRDARWHEQATVLLREHAQGFWREEPKLVVSPLIGLDYAKIVGVVSVSIRRWEGAEYLSPDEMGYRQDAGQVEDWVFGLDDGSSVAVRLHRDGWSNESVSAVWGQAHNALQSRANRLGEWVRDLRETPTCFPEKRDEVIAKYEAERRTLEERAAQLKERMGQRPQSLRGFRETLGGGPTSSCVARMREEVAAAEAGQPAQQHWSAEALLIAHDRLRGQHERVLRQGPSNSDDMGATHVDFLPVGADRGNLWRAIEQLQAAIPSNRAKVEAWRTRQRELEDAREIERRAEKLRLQQEAAAEAQQELAREQASEQERPWCLLNMDESTASSNLPRRRLGYTTPDGYGIVGISLPKMGGRRHGWDVQTTGLDELGYGMYAAESQWTLKASHTCDGEPCGDGYLACELGWLHFSSLRSNEEQSAQDWAGQALDPRKVLARFGLYKEPKAAPPAAPAAPDAPASLDALKAKFGKKR
jgi:hypothetical protein